MSAAESCIVQKADAYNSWPMIQNIGSRLVCAYSRGREHRIEETVRGVFARFSDDWGKTWSDEVMVCNSAEFGDVTIGKGADTSGAALFWIRKCRLADDNSFILLHDLYRTSDGLTFEKIASPELDPHPMQITDIFHIPEKNLMMSLWFSGDYRGTDNNSWGTLVSRDNGVTWEQHVVEDKLPEHQWPTEQSAVYLGNGHIFAISRREADKNDAAGKKVQFQLESIDYGKTWSKGLTNIDDIWESTPSLCLTAEGKICNYYYQRYAGLLKRRSAAVKDIVGNPTSWPEPEIIATASKESCHAGNVNVVAAGNRHFAAYYTGTPENTAVVVLPILTVENGANGEER